MQRVFKVEVNIDPFSHKILFIIFNSLIIEKN